MDGKTYYFGYGIDPAGPNKKAGDSFGSDTGVSLFETLSAAVFSYGLKKIQYCSVVDYGERCKGFGLRVKDLAIDKVLNSQELLDILFGETRHANRIGDGFNQFLQTHEMYGVLYYAGYSGMLVSSSRASLIINKSEKAKISGFGPNFKCISTGYTSVINSNNANAQVLASGDDNIITSSGRDSYICASGRRCVIFITGENTVFALGPEGLVVFRYWDGGDYCYKQITSPTKIPHQEYTLFKGVIIMTKTGPGLTVSPVASAVSPHRIDCLSV